MSSPFLELPAFDPVTERVNVVIETPRGVRNKYKFDPAMGVFRCSKSLTLGMVFPYDFGFIPSTRGEDGDPVDVLVLMEEPTFCGCVVPTRLIGVIEAKQRERNGKTVRNDRLIGVFDKQPSYAEMLNFGDLNKRVLDEIEHFFIAYTEMEGNKKFMPLKRSSAQVAEKLVRLHMNR